MDQPIDIGAGAEPASSSKGRFLTGLVGEGIGASRSPWIHEREADALGVRLIYSTFDLAASGEGAEGLGAILESARRMGFCGLNVTHPFKQRILPLLDELSESASRIGAVNTVTFRNGRSVGYNTDCTGFAEGVRRGLAGERLGDVVQVGAGGGGSATAHALLELGADSLRIFDVDEQRAATLARSLRDVSDAPVQAVSDLTSALRAADGLVNASPVGMVGHEGLPVPVGSLQQSLWVADIVYFPLETELLRRARALGCRTVDGVAMVVFQAAAAFEIFTGLAANRERMLSAALNQWKM